MDNKELKEKIDRVLEVSYAFLGKLATKNAVGVDGSPLKGYLKKIRNGEPYNPETVLRYLIPLRNFFKELGYRYEELADDIDYIIEYIRKEEKKHANNSLT